jgi:hypothetical protein
MNFKTVLLSVLAVGTLQQAFSRPYYLHKADTVNPSSLLGANSNAITTAVPFLAISPDARHAALGDAGVASSPDANSSYWNAAKLVFIDKKYGGTISYTPWLGKIVNDMSISYLSGFYKINREQAVSMSIKYFDLGDISFRTASNDPLGDFNPRELAADVTYSRMLSEELSIGGTGRYIYSNLTGAFAGIDARPAHSVAVDFGVYYRKELQSARNSTLALGATVTNIGGRISYTDATNKNYLPTNLRLGGAYTTQLDPYNSITFLLDFNKLMVPSPNPRRDTLNISYLNSLFSSFSDAPGGAKEELQEVMTSVGIEYWYNEIFAGRIGYFNEAKNKGNRKYMTLGLGFRKDRFGIDVAYLVPTNKREHPLAETIRFTLLFQIKETTREKEESVTD